MDANNREIIRVEGLTKCFGRLKVLDNISISFREHEVVSVIGQSGGFGDLHLGHAKLFSNGQQIVSNYAKIRNEHFGSSFFRWTEAADDAVICGTSLHTLG